MFVFIRIYRSAACPSVETAHHTWDALKRRKAKRAVMKLGFIGTGVITEAIITGLVKSDYPVSDIFISRRNHKVSKRLAMMSSKIHVLDANQAIVDQSDMIFLAVLPQKAKEVLTPLTFGDLAQIVSLIATIPIENCASGHHPQHLCRARYHYRSLQITTELPQYSPPLRMFRSCLAILEMLCLSRR